MKKSLIDQHSDSQGKYRARRLQLAIEHNEVDLDFITLLFKNEEKTDVIKTLIKPLNSLINHYVLHRLEAYAYEHPKCLSILITAFYDLPFERLQHLFQICNESTLTKPYMPPFWSGFIFLSSIECTYPFYNYVLTFSSHGFSDTMIGIKDRIFLDELYTSPFEELPLFIPRIEKSSDFIRGYFKKRFNEGFSEDHIAYLLELSQGDQ